MKPMNILLGSACVAALTNGAIAGIWLNELHYDNAGQDVGEAVEIAADFVIDPELLEVALYNGSNGTVYVTASGFEVNEVEGGSVAWRSISGIQNGGPDGLVVLYDSVVIQFVSYEGTFTATNGVAEGMTSEDLGLSETSSSALGTSLQLTGTGQSYSDFSWLGGVSETFGALNEGQVIAAVPAPGALAILGLAGLTARRRRRD